MDNKHVASLVEKAIGGLSICTNGCPFDRRDGPVTDMVCVQRDTCDALHGLRKMMRTPTPICIDPSQIKVLMQGQTETETLAEYIQRVAREEARKATQMARQARGMFA